MARYDAYVICTAPRSGSTLLCRMLAATGVAGRPESYFYGTSVASWAADLDIAAPRARTEPDLLRAVLAAAIAQGRGDTGLFGLRQQQHSFALLCTKLALLYPGAHSQRALLRHAFGSILYLHLTRRDKVAQAVSLLKAEQTGLWHATLDGRELERLAPPAPAVYDRMLIAERVALLAAQDRAWAAWFDREGIAPLCLSYETLAADPSGTLAEVLVRLGCSTGGAPALEPDLRKLADATSEDWAARFRAETGGP